MKRQELPEVDDSSVSARPVSRGDSALMTVGLVLVGSVLFWMGLPASENPATAPTSHATVIHWRHNPVFSVAWSPDGRKVAASCFGPVVRVWNRDSGRVSEHQGATELTRMVVGWSDDSERLIVSGLTRTIETWTLVAEDGEATVNVSHPPDQKSTMEAFIRTADSRPIRLWGESDHRFDLPSKTNSIAFSKDGQWYATGGLEGELGIVDQSSGRILRTIEVDRRGISAVCFSPDGTQVSASGPGPLRIWDVSSGREVARLGPERCGSTTLGFSPDGSKLAVACWDGSIQIWDLATATASTSLQGHHGQILTLAWSPDGKLLASGGYDSTVRIWEVESDLWKTASR